jgi:hypothetical protein
MGVTNFQFSSAPTLHSCLNVPGAAVAAAAAVLLLLFLPPPKYKCFRALKECSLLGSTASWIVSVAKANTKLST